MAGLRLLSKKTEWTLSTDEIWKALDDSDVLSNYFRDQLHLAWWAHPGGGKACFTADEIDEAFDQYILVCRRLDFSLRNAYSIHVVGSEYDRS